MQLFLGMQCVYPRAFSADPARLARLADLAADPRWSHRFKLVQADVVPADPPMPPPPRVRGPVPAARLRAVALEALSSPSTAIVSFSMSRKETGDHADFHVPTGRNVVSRDDDVYSANARLRLPPDQLLEEVVAGWVELQHEILETLGALHGVITTDWNAYVNSAERWLSLTSVDGKVMHPHPDEISSYGAQWFWLGTKYIRKPRWGTYLKPAHVEAVGGRAKILEVVKPPVVRDVGDLLYVQLSERVADATSEAARMRWKAFAELLAPIVMPALERPSALTALP